MIALFLAPALAWSPSSAEEGLVKALSTRDGAPPCAQLEAMVPEPVESLQRIVENVEMPPWAPMTAASCLIERHASEKPELLQQWVTGENTKGLARLVFNRLHLIEAPQRRTLVTRARTGPWATHLEPALESSADPEVRALAE